MAVMRGWTRGASGRFSTACFETARTTRPIGASRHQVSQLPQIGRVVRAVSETAVENRPLAPRVWTGIGKTAMNGSIPGNVFQVIEWQLRLVDRDAPFVLQVGPPVAEDQSVTLLVDSPGNDRVGGIRKPDPDEPCARLLHPGGARSHCLCSSSAVALVSEAARGVFPRSLSLGPDVPRPHGTGERPLVPLPRTRRPIRHSDFHVRSCSSLCG